MPWRPLDSVKIGPEFKRKTRFLVDESLGSGAARFLRERGYNVEFVSDVGLAGRDDTDVYAYAWREKRMLLTHDRDFMDDAKFPEHRNPGVVVLPGGDGNVDAMVTGISTALAVFGSGAAIWEKTKSTVSSAGEMTIRGRNLETGKVETDRFRLTREGADIWED